MIKDYQRENFPMLLVNSQLTFFIHVIWYPTKCTDRLQIKTVQLQ